MPAETMLAGVKYPNIDPEPDPVSGPNRPSRDNAVASGEGPAGGAGAGGVRSAVRSRSLRGGAE